MSRTAEIEAIVASARDLDAPMRGLSDEELLAEAAAWEALGRLVDARSAAAAAEVQFRSRPRLRDEGLAARHGERNAVDLLVKECRISTREARRRITIGTPLAPRLSLTGEELDGRFPVLAAAVTGGEVPLDSARLIVDTLAPLRRRIPPEELEPAEAALTDAATRIDPDLRLIHTTQWAMRLDQDGAKPAEEQARAAHHVPWFVRDKGRTEVDNGDALCSHHHVIHSTTRWEIRTHQRLPHLVPKGRPGTPLPHHRMQRHHIHQPPPTKRRT